MKLFGKCSNSSSFDQKHKVLFWIMYKCHNLCFVVLYFWFCINKKTKISILYFVKGIKCIIHIVYFWEILYLGGFLYREHACALFKNNTVLVSRPPWSTAEDLWHQGCWDEATRTPGLWRSAPKPNLRRGFGAEVLSCAGLSAPPRRKPGAQALYINKKVSKTKSFKMKTQSFEKEKRTLSNKINKICLI